MWWDLLSDLMIRGGCYLARSVVSVDRAGPVHFHVTVSRRRMSSDELTLILMVTWTAEVD